MAVEISDGGGTPHATNYSDLLDKLVTFATANGWTELENTSDKVVLQGEGSGDDEIIIAFQKYANAGADSYGWHLQGYTGYNGDGVGFASQPGAIPQGGVFGRSRPSVPLWNSTIPYWFVVNSRRIMVVAKVSTVYTQMYAGWYLPYASPNQYPYPMAIGGSYIQTNTLATPRWSNTTDQHNAFWSGAGGSSTNGTALLAKMLGGEWWSQGNTWSSNSPNFSSAGTFPYCTPSLSLLRGSPDGGAVLTPVEIRRAVSSGSVVSDRLGELDGVYHVDGFGRSAEDVVTVDSEDFLIVPNIYRSSNVDYVAIKLV